MRAGSWCCGHHLAWGTEPEGHEVSGSEAGRGEAGLLFREVGPFQLDL